MECSVSADVSRTFTLSFSLMQKERRVRISAELAYFVFPFMKRLQKLYTCLMFRDLKIDEKCVDAIDVCEYGLCHYVVTC